MPLKIANRGWSTHWLATALFISIEGPPGLACHTHAIEQRNFDCAGVTRDRDSHHLCSLPSRTPVWLAGAAGSKPGGRSGLTSVNDLSQQDHGRGAGRR